MKEYLKQLFQNFIVFVFSHKLNCFIAVISFIIGAIIF